MLLLETANVATELELEVTVAVVPIWVHPLAAEIVSEEDISLPRHHSWYVAEVLALVLFTETEVIITA